MSQATNLNPHSLDPNLPGFPPTQQDIADIQEALGRLYQSVDGLQNSNDQSVKHTNGKLDEWIATNRQLLAVFQNLMEAIAQHSETSQQVLSSSSSQQQSLLELTNQLSRFQQALGLIQTNQQALQAVAAQSEAIQTGFERHNQRLLELHERLSGLEPVLNGSINPSNGSLAMSLPTSEQMAQLKNDLKAVLSESISQVRLALPSAATHEPVADHRPVGSAPRKPRVRSRVSESLLLLLLLTIVVLLGLLGVGSGFFLSRAISPQLDMRGLTPAESELLGWAQTAEGKLARDMMRWNPEVAKICVESIEQLGGKCVLWVVPPRQHPRGS